MNKDVIRGVSGEARSVALGELLEAAKGERELGVDVERGGGEAAVVEG